MTLSASAQQNSDPRTAALVDQIGRLKAQIAPTLATLKKLEAALKDYGPGRYAGALFEGNVFASERSTLDMAAARAKLSPQFIAAHTSVTEVITLKVTARQLGDDSVGA